MADKKIMKDIGLNDPVSVTLPAHAWLGFIAAYGCTKWESEDARAIANEAIAQLLDPVYQKEREAARSEHRDQHQSIMQAFITGRLPEVPPNMEDEH